MTVSVQTTFTASVASGATTVFPYGFKIAHADDLTVTVDGVEQATGFSVTNVGDASGGDVVFDVSPTAGAKVVRYLNPILKRETDYQQFGDWMALVINLDFDRLWLAMQMLAQNTIRSLKLPVDTAVNQEITEDAATRANKGFKFDGAGNLILSDYDPDAAQTAGAAALAAAVEAEASAALAAASAASIPSMTGGADTVLVINPTNNGWLYKTATQMRTFLGLGTAAQSNAGDFQAADADIPTVAASQVEMETGIEAALRSMSPLRVAQAIAAKSLGIGQTWQDVLGSRTSGTTYTNSTGKPIMVCVSGTTAAAAAGGISATVDGVVVVTSTVYGPGASYQPSVTFVVPNGATYSATYSGSGSITTWAELR